MNYLEKVRELVGHVVTLARKERKLSGFTIGNTSKVEGHRLYFTPLRRNALMVTAGVVVYSDAEACAITKLVDGLVDYLLVDGERKIPNRHEVTNLSNVEDTVRQNTVKSKIWVYKGNDISVDAVDGLVTCLTNRDAIGLAKKKIAILGSGNIGFKLALRFVERGANVVITRRNAATLECLVQAINYVKPAFTDASVTGLTDNELAVENANIVIGCSSGSPLVHPAMLERLAAAALIIDVGKGMLTSAAIRHALAKNMRIYRLDITAAFEGLVHRLWAVEDLINNKLGRRDWHGECIISGGLLGAKEEVVVDNIYKPSVIYGIADGCGDFFRELTPKQEMRLQRLREFIDADQNGNWNVEGAEGHS